MTSPIHNRTAIVGVGSTPMLRHTDESLGSVAVDAALAAIEDAGLTTDNIDGFFGCGGAPNGSAVHLDGVDEVSAHYMVTALGLKNARWVKPLTGLPPNALADTTAALLAGYCDYALLVKAMYNPAGVRYEQVEHPFAEGASQFVLPYGLGGAGGRHAHWLQRYMYQSGATREDLFNIVQNDRQNAQRNPLAYWRGKDLTLDDYLKSRWIYEPMCLFDCDIPVTAAGALVVTTAERARDLRQRPAYISGFASVRQQKDALFEVCEVTRDDIDLAQIYDGFSHFVWYWLEQLGFCGLGEAPAYAQPARIGLDGELPLNTFGGSLGEGRLHGFGHLREAALQVMGRGGERQVPNAKHCLVAVGVGIDDEVSGFGHGLNDAVHTVLSAE